MKTRRGVSLVELTIIMSACTVVLTLSAVLMHRAMRTYAQATACRDAERSAMRLSDQFRLDVHQARAGSIDRATLGAGVVLRLELADGQTAEYRRQESAILRILSKDGSAVSRDEYVFSPSCKVNVVEAFEPRRISLTIATAPADPPVGNAKRPLAMEEVPVSLQAEAVLGRDARFAIVPSAQEKSE
jgi:hypothetical protein